MTVSFLIRRGGTQTRRRSHVGTEAETRAMWPQVQGPGSPQKLEEAGRILPRTCRKHGPVTP